MGGHIFILTEFSEPYLKSLVVGLEIQKNPTKYMQSQWSLFFGGSNRSLYLWKLYHTNRTHVWYLPIYHK